MAEKCQKQTLVERSGRTHLAELDDYVATANGPVADYSFENRILIEVMWTLRNFVLFGIILTLSNRTANPETRLGRFRWSHLSKGRRLIA
jgi:hypothetical protein